MNPPRPRQAAAAQTAWEALAEYRISENEAGLSNLEGRVLAIEIRERTSLVDDAEFRAGVVTRSQAPEVIEAARLAGEAQARAAAKTRLRQAGWSIFFLFLGLAAKSFWDLFWVAPK